MGKFDSPVVGTGSHDVSFCIAGTEGTLYLESLSNDKDIEMTLEANCEMGPHPQDR